MKVFEFHIFLINLIVLTSADQMLETVRKEGIPIECHYITTQDGYSLRIYHLLRPADNDKTTLKTILFMHGLHASSLDYVLYPNNSAGYYFYNQGLDVWLGNARGNTFSRNHTTLDPNNHEFWKFSWHEIGVFDMPAIIDFILTNTQRDSIIYSGHSQGATVIFVLLSEHPEYNDKISSVHAMAPGVIVKYTQPFMNYLLPHINEAKALAEKLQLYEWNSYKDSEKSSRIIGEMCLLSFFADFCKFIYGQLFGPVSSRSFYKELLLDISNISPSGSSYLQYFHFLQNVKSGGFQKFDYGPSANLDLYKNTKPPPYNLSNISTKIHILYGLNDMIVRPENIPILRDKIQKTVVVMSKMKLLNHVDFTIGHSVNSVNSVIFQVIKKFT